MDLKELEQAARDAGFDLFGIADASDPKLKDAIQRYTEWLRAGHGATMEYLSRHLVKKSDPGLLLNGVKRVICVGLFYGTGKAEQRDKMAKDPRISVYARGQDYHAVFDTKLRVLSESLSKITGAPTEAFVPFCDAQPVFDRFWAAQAGLGWIGKNTCLIHRRHGSYFFIGGLLSTVITPVTAPTTDHCGRCTRCIDACPTQAIIPLAGSAGTSYVVNSTRCISYQTIENRGEIPETLRDSIGTWIAGCDICQEVCPWNDPHPKGTEFDSPHALGSMNLLEMLKLSVPDYRRITQGTALSRIKPEQFFRNARIALKNSEK